MRKKSKRKILRSGCAIGCVALCMFSSIATAQDASDSTVPNAADASTTARTPVALRKQLIKQGERLDEMRSQMAAQGRRLDEMRRELAAQQADYDALRRSVGMQALAKRRGNADDQANGSTANGTVPATPVGQAPRNPTAPPTVAPIFDQPGVLTPRGKFVLEPSYQFGYSSTDRVALIGYTIIPAILIGLIDVRQVRITTQTAALTARYGITNRLEVEVRVPYVDGHTDTTSREILTGSATDRVFTTSGHGLGDIEATLRYQFNDGGADSPYYIGWLRFKSRTGRDLFEVTTDCAQRCVENTTGTGLPLEMPTGSGFYSLQPGLTWLFPSDPVVFFGNFSYLHNFPRDNVSLTLVGGVKQPLGRFAPGDIFDANIGMGLALNDKATISFGYDQSFVGATKVNGKTWPGSTRTVLGTLLVGGSYRFSPTHTLNVALGVGVTRDTPDATLTLRMPITF